MWDGAKITNNKRTASGDENGTVDILLGQFTMHGGEISNNEHRGVSVGSGGSDTTTIFTMKGGVIKNNSKTISQSGGGVYVAYETTFNMEGGEISNNGTADMPGSGIFTNTEIATGDWFVLNGPVTISNNTVAFLAWDGEVVGVKIGSNFSSNNTIATDLIGWDDNTATAFAGVWNGNQVIYGLQENGELVTIDEKVTTKFTPINCCIPNDLDVLEPEQYYYHPEFNYGINNSGVVVNNAGD
jgi:hypothetical protein